MNHSKLKKGWFFSSNIFVDECMEKNIIKKTKASTRLFNNKQIIK